MYANKTNLGGQGKPRLDAAYDKAVNSITSVRNSVTEERGEVPAHQFGNEWRLKIEGKRPHTCALGSSWSCCSPRGPGLQNLTLLYVCPVVRM